MLESRDALVFINALTRSVRDRNEAKDEFVVSTARWLHQRPHKNKILEISFLRLQFLRPSSVERFIEIGIEQTIKFASTLWGLSLLAFTAGAAHEFAQPPNIDVGMFVNKVFDGFVVSEEAVSERFTAMLECYCCAGFAGCSRNGFTYGGRIHVAHFLPIS